MTPKTDIIIPFRSTYQFPTEAYLERCLVSLFEHTHNYRLIVVDDNSDEQGRAFLDKTMSALPEAVLVRTFKQRWFTRAVNLGFRMVRTPWCVELNSDVVLNPGWLEELYALVTEIESQQLRSRVGLVGSVYSPDDPRRFIVTREPDYVTGHCWLCNMEALGAVGQYQQTPKDPLCETNSRSIHIFSDNYLCYAMNRLGWITVKSHHSHVDHVAGKSWGHLLGLIPVSLESVEYRYE